jgi:hypothetical protein
MMHGAMLLALLMLHSKSARVRKRNGESYLVSRFAFLGEIAAYESEIKSETLEKFLERLSESERLVEFFTWRLLSMSI